MKPAESPSLKKRRPPPYWVPALVILAVGYVCWIYPAQNPPPPISVSTSK